MAILQVIIIILKGILEVGDKMKQKLILDAAQEILDKKNHISITKENQKQYSSNVGDYYLIKYNAYTLIKNTKMITNQIQKAIKTLLKKYKLPRQPKVLIVGLGSTTIIADSLGPRTADKIIATNHYDDFVTIPKIEIFNPSVISKTGIHSFHLIKMINDDIKPDFLLFIDSMETTSMSHINSIIEINDHGIIPGTYLNTNKEITKDTFRKPIISVGIPLVYRSKKVLLTAPNINEIIEETSNLLSSAINSIFFD